VRVRAVAALRNRRPDAGAALRRPCVASVFGIVSTAIIQMIAIGWLTLRDKRAEPIYPRWSRTAVWGAIGVIPAALVLVVHSRHLRVNGILA